MSKPKTLIEYIDCFIRVHDSKYDYSLIEPKHIINSKSKISIICKEHGEFSQIINNHMSGNGCRECKKERLSNEFRQNIDLLIEDFKKIHDSKYDYSLISKENYKNNLSELPIICNVHGVFFQTAGNHKSDHGCPKCQIEKRANLKRNKLEDIIAILEMIHGTDKYDFSLISEQNYKNRKSKVPIICKEHGIFYKSFDDLSKMTNCPRCLKVSKLEQRTEKWLIDNHFDYEKQKRFGDCKGIKNKLPFDFYISKLNLNIECDGRQHYEPVQFGGCSIQKALECFEIIKTNDSIKNKYCLDNNIKLLRISYKDNLIEKLNECL